MTAQSDFLVKIVEKLKAAGIPYMVSGSLASSYHGQPRATNDIDLVIEPTAEQLGTLVRSLESEFYVSREAALDALAHRSMFNVIDVSSGWKADLIIRKARPFSAVEFERRKAATLIGVELSVVTPEDAILSKLEWSKEGSSERQFRDALSVARARWGKLDKQYLIRWAESLGVADLLQQLFQQVEASLPPGTSGP